MWGVGATCGRFRKLRLQKFEIFAPIDLPLLHRLFGFMSVNLFWEAGKGNLPPHDFSKLYAQQAVGSCSERLGHDCWCPLLEGCIWNLEQVCRSSKTNTKKQKYCELRIASLFQSLLEAGCAAASWVSSLMPRGAAGPHNVILHGIHK